MLWNFSKNLITRSNINCFLWFYAHFEGIFKAYLVGDRFGLEPVETGLETAVHPLKCDATATGGLVLIGPVRSVYRSFCGCVDWTFKH